MNAISSVARGLGKALIPEIEHCDLGGDYVEGYFSISSFAAFLSLQTGLPYETVEARIIEAHGYCRRPPKSGSKVILMQRHPDEIDNQAILAMRRVVDDFVTAEGVRAIKTSYLAAEHGDAYWVAWDLDIHPYFAIAILDNLEERGELPPRFD